MFCYFVKPLVRSTLYVAVAHNLQISVTSLRVYLTHCVCPFWRKSSTIQSESFICPWHQTQWFKCTLVILIGVYSTVSLLLIILTLSWLEKSMLSHRYYRINMSFMWQRRVDSFCVTSSMFLITLIAERFSLLLDGCSKKYRIHNHESQLKWVP